MREGRRERPALLGKPASDTVIPEGKKRRAIWIGGGFSGRRGEGARRKKLISGSFHRERLRTRADRKEKGGAILLPASGKVIFSPKKKGGGGSADCWVKGGKGGGREFLTWP